MRSGGGKLKYSLFKLLNNFRRKDKKQIRNDDKNVENQISTKNMCIYIYPFEYPGNGIPECHPDISN